RRGRPLERSVGGVAVSLPARCFFDDPVQVTVTGLRSKQLVTMKARSTDDKGVMFSSSATYRADGSGEIHLDRDPSLSGSYVGVEPMGLLWSMKADTLHKRLHEKNPLIPYVVKFSVHEEEEGSMLAEVINERFLLPFYFEMAFSHVLIGFLLLYFVLCSSFSFLLISLSSSVPVFCLPNQFQCLDRRGPFPAVLDLSSSRSERRACLLANKGFVVLSITLYNDKPANLKEIHLDYLEEAVDFLKQHSKVGSEGIGVLSRSKGSDIALSLAAFVPGIKAVVWINGCNANVALPLSYKKRQILPPLLLNLTKLIPTQSGALNGKYVLDNPLAEENKDTLIPIERAKGHFLFVASEDDINWDSKAYMDDMVERLRRHGKENFESVSYPGAGHLLEPPYGPHCYSCSHITISKPVVWGGEARAHAAAEVHLWKKIQEFFRTHLSCDLL
uniref:Acyl-coenzyme A thioesterase 1-like n=1 Tax=Stegastes partitus TaxID=144197 RepID=A0A3B5BBV1_9TELE